MKKIVLIIGLALDSVACSGGDNGNGGNSGDDGEYDCDAVAMVEPLPSGTRPVELVGTWDCEDFSGLETSETYNSNGTLFSPNTPQPA